MARDIQRDFMARIVSHRRLIALICMLVSASTHAGTLDARLRSLSASYGHTGQTRANTTAVAASGSLAPHVDSAGRVQVYIHAANRQDATIVIANLEALGAVHIVASPELGVVQAWVPVDSLNTVATLPGVERVALPAYVRPRHQPKPVQRFTEALNPFSPQVRGSGSLAIDADAVTAMRAAGLQSNGETGLGVQVGVISDDNSGLRGSQAGGYLPGSVWADPSFPGTTATPGDPAEGTAMLEEVHAMAPGATLGFCAPQTTVELLTCYKDFVAWGATVITDDLEFQGVDMFSAGLTNDGDVAYAVAQITAAHSNVAIISPGGNDAQDYFQAKYTAGPGGVINGIHYSSLMDFGAAVGGASSTRLSVYFLDTLEFTPEYQWNDPINTSPDQLQIYLVDGNGNVLASGTTTTSSDGRAGQSLSYTPANAGEVDYIEIACIACANPVSFKLNGHGDGLVEFGPTTGGAISDGQAIAPGVLTTVAAQMADSIPLFVALEQFSAAGPFLYGDYGATATLARPNLTGIDNVIVSGAGGFTGTGPASGGGVYFKGTSATGPNVGGLIADIMSGTSGLGHTANDYYVALENTANTTVFIGGTPYSANAAGSGLAQGVAGWDAIAPSTIPDISSVSPTSTTVGSAFTLTVTGVGFVSGAVVNFNSSALTTTFVNSTTLQAAVPASATAIGGTINVTVTDPAPGGLTSSPEAYVIMNPRPTISNTSPDSALAGGPAFTLTVNGTGFVNGIVLSFNGTPLPTTFVSSTQITVTVPAADIAIASQATLTLTNPAPTPNGLVQETYFVDNPTATLTSMTPACAAVGGPDFVITLFGTGFVQGQYLSNAFVPGYYNGTSVWFNGGSTLTANFVSPTEMTVIVPAADIGPTANPTSHVSVLNYNGEFTLGANTDLSFQVNATASGQTPLIQSLSTSISQVGNSPFTLTVNGSNFTSGAVAYLNGYPLATTVVSSTQLTALVSSAALGQPGTYGLTVMNLDQPCAAAAHAPFTVYAAAVSSPPVSGTITPPVTTPVVTQTGSSKGGGGGFEMFELLILGLLAHRQRDNRVQN